ncbi:unnamed protein product [Nezara viridula]|uniref:Phospholipase B1, membrane-associated n=1 Tax=Nezara viridula TaxID=85310 RepID=A0A9P0MW45_NEZVI|nr:unnamed protein product [Nezara viridula]
MLQALVVAALLASSAGQQFLPQTRFTFNPYDVSTYLKSARMAEVNPKEQEKIAKQVKFPCSLKKSSKVPDRVDRLRPGDVAVVAAMGDSLIAGNGALENNALGSFIESRGVSWAAGGDEDWHDFLTLPNILKEMNPNLTGYSQGRAEFLTPVSALNVAFPISADNSALSQAKTLVAKMRQMLGKRYATDWKVVTILFGANDLCSGQCYNARASSPSAHAYKLRQALDYLQDNMPRAFVNLVSALDVTVSVRIKRSMVCRIIHRFFCSCYHMMSNPLETLARMARLYQKHEKQLIESGRYNVKPDFTVVIQPFMTAYNMPLNEKYKLQEVIDISYITYDCFHFSQKGHALVANMLWNNMLEPVGSKSTRKMKNMFDKFYCPSEDNPYFFTTNNSIAFYKTGRQDGIKKMVVKKRLL